MPSTCMLGSQETAQKITQGESVMVMQNLISISAAEILCKRGVIREESLEPIKFAGTQLRRVKEGACADPKVNRLASWMRDGLLEALRNNHLRSLIFEIHGDPECKSLLEMYRFDVESMSAISISRQAKETPAKSTTNPVQICVDKDAIKLGTQALLRKIKAIVETFEDGEEQSRIPDEHYLAMKMVYYPSDDLNNFQPAGFCQFPDQLLDVNDDDDGADMEIGSLRTEHHSLCVRMKHRSIGKLRNFRASPFPTQNSRPLKNRGSKSSNENGLKPEDDNTTISTPGKAFSNDLDNSQKMLEIVCSQEETCRNDIPNEKKLLVSVPAHPIHQIREWSPPA